MFKKQRRERCHSAPLFYSPFGNQPFESFYARFCEAGRRALGEGLSPVPAPPSKALWDIWHPGPHVDLHFTGASSV